MSKEGIDYGSNVYIILKGNPLTIDQIEDSLKEFGDDAIALNFPLDKRNKEITAEDKNIYINPAIKIKRQIGKGNNTSFIFEWRHLDIKLTEDFIVISGVKNPDDYNSETNAVKTLTLTNNNSKTINLLQRIEDIIKVKIQEKAKEWNISNFPEKFLGTFYNSNLNVLINEQKKSNKTSKIPNIFFQYSSIEEYKKNKGYLPLKDDNGKNVVYTKTFKNIYPILNKGILHKTSIISLRYITVSLAYNITSKFRANRVVWTSHYTGEDDDEIEVGEEREVNEYEDDLKILAEESECESPDVALTSTEEVEEE